MEQKHGHGQRCMKITNGRNEVSIEEQTRWNKI